MIRKLNAVALAGVAIALPLGLGTSAAAKNVSAEDPFAWHQCPNKQAPYFVDKAGWELLGRDGTPMNAENMTAEEIKKECAALGFTSADDLKRTDDAVNNMWIAVPSDQLIKQPDLSKTTDKEPHKIAGTPEPAATDSLWGKLKTLFNEPQDVVAIDAWWTVDYGKNACAHNERLRKSVPEAWSADVFGACIGSENGWAWNFINDLASQAAVVPLCNGLTFIVYGGPKVENPPMDAAPTYTLISDYTPGQKKQTWDLQGSKGHSLSVRGEGSPREIIRDVCTAIKGHGAKVIQ